jgi:hypothetical protein
MPYLFERGKFGLTAHDREHRIRLMAPCLRKGMEPLTALAAPCKSGSMRRIGPNRVTVSAVL